MIALTADLVRSRRVLLGGVGLALVAIAVGYLALYPSLEEQLANMAADLPDVYRALLGDVDLASPTGYIRSQVYSLLGPLLVAGGCIAAGSSLARAERDRTLAVMVVTPLGRRRVAAAWAGFVVVAALLAGVAIVVGVTLGAPLAGTPVSLMSTLGATIPVVVFGVAAGAAALLGSVATGSPGVATALGWSVVVWGFVSNSISELIVSASWLASVSPWAWHGSGRGIGGPVDATGLVLLTTMSIVLVTASVHWFQRRDLHV